MRYLAVILFSLAVISVCTLGIVWIVRGPDSPTPEIFDGAGDALSETLDVAREAKQGLELLATSLTGEPQSRVWTHIDGRTVEAVMTDATQTMVTIRRTEDGRAFRVSLDSLSRADQVYVRAWLERNQP